MSACRYSQYLLVMSLSMLMVGCAGEPSEQDIHKAYAAEIEQGRAQVDGEDGEQLAELLEATELHSVKKLGCRKAELNSGYICDVKVDMTAPLLGRVEYKRSERFVKNEDGWVVIN